jgi:glycosyltransferase involved in cell wall biosynthesis
MKVSLISYADTGGAGAACYRLYKGLRESGRCSPTLIVRNKGRNDSSVRTAVAPRDTFSSLLKDGVNLLRRKVQVAPVPGIVRNINGDSFAERVLSASQPDLVNLHWLGDDFFPLNQVTKLKIPVVWTMHDMWTFTGGCHYTSGCNHFTKGCGNCPFHKGDPKRDQTKKDVLEKKMIVETGRHVFIAPSRWLLAHAKASTVLKDSRVETIPYSIDTQVFRPVNRISARDILGLPHDKTLLLFGSAGGTSDLRKGYDLLEKAILKISGNNIMKSTELVIFGREFAGPDPGIPVHFIGEVTEERMLAALYSACDVMILPSREDNLPLTALESVSCGLPIISFGVGGLSEIVLEGVNGFLCKEVTSGGLADAIHKALINGDYLSKLRDSTRMDAVKRYDLKIQANAYCNLFEEVYSQAL